MIINFNKSLPHSPETIKNALEKLEEYHLWWPTKFRIAHTNHKGFDQLYFSPVFGITIIWEVEWQNNTLYTFYKNGPVTGQGKWIIEPNGNETNLHYNIEVTPKNLFWKAILIPSMFKRTHLKHMESLFIQLNSFLNNH